MNLMVDFAFKRLFGQPQGADLLIDFLNAVLRRKEEQRIVELEFHNTEFPAQDRTDKTIRLDVLVRTNRGDWIDVEVQVAAQNTIVKRSLLYWSRLYDEQIQRGQDYGVLKPAIVIQIADFVLITSTERFHTSYHVVEDREGFRFTDDFELHVIEMPKFWDWLQNGHTVDEALKDPLQKWLLLLFAQRDERIREELEAITVSDTMMEKAFNLWEALSKDPENWAAYVNRDMAIRDMNQMKREALEEGREEGLKKGLQEGRQKGRQEGLQEARREMAKAMVKKGMDGRDISDLTGLPLSVVEQLSKEKIE
jgi:predicted transposase/invertase (TIGR01784 family)